MAESPAVQDVLQCMRRLNDAVQRLTFENAELRRRLHLQGSTESPPAPLTSPDIVEDGETHLPRDEDKAGQKRRMTKKLQAAYQETTNRIVSTFARMEPSNTDNKVSRLRTYAGHTDGIWDVDVHTLGSRTIMGSASADRSARLWDVESGRCLLSYDGHLGSVNGISMTEAPAASDDGALLCCTASGDGSAHLWIAAAKQIRDLESVAEVNVEADFGDGMDNLEPGPTCIIDTPRRVLMGHASAVSATELLLHGTQALTASWDRTARLWDCESGSSLLELTGHDAELTDVAVRPQTCTVVTCSKDSTFRMWDLRQSAIREVNICRGHSAAVSSVVFLGGNLLASGGDDHTVKFWDIRKLRAPTTTIRVNDDVNRMSASANGKYIAVPVNNSCVKIYSTSGARIARTPRRNRRGHRSLVMATAWAPDDSLLSCGFDKLIIRWRLNKNLEKAEAKTGFNRRSRDPNLSATAAPSVAAAADE